jgi:hypothetical protein
MYNAFAIEHVQYLLDKCLDITEINHFTVSLEIL